jgi:hypothetical protein
MAPPSTCTLLDLVRAVNEYAKDDDETVATVAYLINSSKVMLCGIFAGAKIDLRPGHGARRGSSSSPPSKRTSA